MKSTPLFLLMIVFAVSVSFAGSNNLQFETFFSVDRLGTPVVSPDGNLVAFTVTKANISENSYSTQIWLVDRSGNNLRQLTTHTASSGSPVFSPDGKFIYFTSKRTDASQVWKLNLNGGEAIQVTDVYGDVEAFVVSPDGKQLLLQRSVPPDCPDEASIKEKSEAQANNPVKARVIDNLMYRHWNSWLEGKYIHLFLYTIESKTIKDLTPGPVHSPPIALGSSQDFTFSPDSKEIAFASNHDKQIAVSTNNDVFILNGGSEKAFQISTSPGNDN
ncbi:MAG: S9 family peptidase, partial [Calditrichales bacterium]